MKKARSTSVQFFAKSPAPRTRQRSWACKSTMLPWKEARASLAGFINYLQNVLTVREQQEETLTSALKRSSSLINVESLVTVKGKENYRCLPIACLKKKKKDCYFQTRAWNCEKRPHCNPAAHLCLLQGISSGQMFLKHLGTMNLG